MTVPLKYYYRSKSQSRLGITQGTHFRLSLITPRWDHLVAEKQVQGFHLFCIIGGWYFLCNFVLTHVLYNCILFPCNQAHHIFVLLFYFFLLSSHLLLA